MYLETVNVRQVRRGVWVVREGFFRKHVISTRTAERAIEVAREFVRAGGGGRVVICDEQNRDIDVEDFPIRIVRRPRES